MNYQKVFVKICLLQRILNFDTPLDSLTTLVTSFASKVHNSDIIFKHSLIKLICFFFNYNISS